MNERIKELLEQAGVKFVVMPKDTEYEKFAKLIIKECVEVVKWTPSMSSNENYVKNIKQHFGVEE
jgi:methanogenic corrinoid protein MtbC1